MVVQQSVAGRTMTLLLLHMKTGGVTMLLNESGFVFQNQISFLYSHKAITWL